MQEIKFAEARETIADVARRAQALADYAFLKDPVTDFQRVFDEKRRETRLHVAVCGAYSSGKSTLVAFLTGRKDIKTGQGIVTDKASEYECDDWTIVDTPGICAGRPQHDEISLKFIERADLLIYMIPSKGFSPEVEKNFKDTIMGRYADKTMLVMGRINDVEIDNLPAKRQDVAEVLGGKELLAKYRFCMLDVEVYKSGLEENDDELKTISRMTEFKGLLDDFLRQKGAYGKCLALMDVVEGFVKAAMEVCETKLVRDEIAARQKKALENAMRRYQRSFLDAKGRMLATVSRERSEMLALLSDGSSELEEKLKTLSDRLEKAVDDQAFLDDQESIFSELRKELSDIDEQVVTLDKRLAEACGGLSGGGMPFDFSKWKAGLGKLGDMLSGMSKETLVKIVHFFGGKFKPWGAVKWTKFLKGAGAAVGVIIETVSTVNEIREEKKADDARREMVRNFDEIESNVRKFYDDLESTAPYQNLKAAKDRLDAMEKDRVTTNAQKDEALEKLIELNGQVIKCREALKQSSEV